MVERVHSRLRKDKAKRVTTKSSIAEWNYNDEEYSMNLPIGVAYRPGVVIRFGSLGLIDLFGPTYALEDASAYHDYLYQNRDKHEFSRAEADAVMLADKDDPYWIRLVAWSLIRVFGGFAW